MQAGKPSRTARTVAAHRAAHQLLEHGAIFEDSLALAILGDSDESVRREAGEHPLQATIRRFIAIRARFAEDALAAAIDAGVRQVVVLGAGLDTFAYRSPLRGRVHTFEVDHPATQAWKRERLAHAGIEIPLALTFVPVDFEHEKLAGALSAAGLDRALPTFFSWLGAVVYLSVDAVWTTLDYVARFPHGAQVVLDYSDPPSALSPQRRAMHDMGAARTAAVGEPWLTFFDPATLRTELLRRGFSAVEDLGPREIARRYGFDRVDASPNAGAHLLHATAEPTAAAEPVPFELTREDERAGFPSSR